MKASCPAVRTAQGGLHDRQERLHQRLGPGVVRGLNAIHIRGGGAARLTEGLDVSGLDFARMGATIIRAIDPRLSWTGYLVGAGTALALAIALLDPQVTSGLSLPMRLLFWLANVGAALAILEITQLALGRTPLARWLAPLPLVIVAGVLGSALFAGVSLVTLDQIIAQDADKTPDVLSVLGFLQEIRDSAGETVLFWVLLNSPRLIIMAQQDDSERQSGPEEAGQDGTHFPEPDAGMDATLVELRRRLPRRLGTDIVALTAELHYLRVHTRLGEALILMSFGRAVEALARVPGMAVHRSHWVAFNHVASLRSDADHVVCVMDTGLDIPVSRRNRSRLRAALREHDEAQIKRRLEDL